jgi:flagellar operon protein
MSNHIQTHHLNQLPKPTMLPKRQGVPTTSFKDLLNKVQVNEKIELTVSKHAQKRLNDRGITIDEQKWSQISKKVQEAKSKGVQDSLVILDNAALIVSAKNSTVITALDRDEARAQIFTNINGTILID